MEATENTILRDWVIKMNEEEGIDKSKIFPVFLPASILTRFKYTCRNLQLNEVLEEEVLQDIEKAMNSDMVFIYMLHYCYGIILHKVNNKIYSITTKKFLNKSIGMCIARSQKIYPNISFSEIQNEVSRFAIQSNDMNHNISLLLYTTIILPRLDIYLKDEPELKQACLDDLYWQVFNWYVIDYSGFFSVFDLYDGFMKNKR